MSGLTAMFESYKGTPWFPNALGGYVGIHLYRKFLADALGPFGTGLLLGTVYLFALLFVITRDIGSEIEDIMTNFTAWKAARAAKKAAMIEEKAKREAERQDVQRFHLRHSLRHQMLHQPIPHADFAGDIEKQEQSGEPQNRAAKNASNV